MQFVEKCIKMKEFKEKYIYLPASLPLFANSQKQLCDIPCLLPWIISMDNEPLLKRVNYKRKEFALTGANSFLLKVDPH